MLENHHLVKLAERNVIGQFHPLTISSYKETYTSVLNRGLEEAPVNVLPMLVDESMRLIMPELYLHGPTPLVKLCLKRAQQASTAHFQLLMQAGKPVEIELDEQKMSIVGVNRGFTQMPITGSRPLRWPSSRETGELSTASARPRTNFTTRTNLAPMSSTMN